ncbi:MULTISPECIES: flavoprotein [Actinoalloteichus]|uniref:Flavoprotein n=1 Tax=Actinoalloteichus fjordicus TaxID=1612552 RepID=A0AAC9LBQ1_9PSEU|nr:MULTISPECIES: flavoprotein [Actinoalloteichus]APU13394.1 Flavoprotein [Actinoalloteichus fjordicus]APU19344.1 Flavoprotein [Actinoalloteichus sp. GBA129-24]
MTTGVTTSPGAARPPMIGIVASAAGGLERLRAGLVEPALASGWRVGVTLTPTAARWLNAVGEVEAMAAVTGLPVRSESRLPGTARPHPPVDCYVLAPASANTVAKLALGIGDNQALTQVGEAVGDPRVPVVVFPRVNAAHARHPAWPGHLAALRNAGVGLVEGPKVFPLAEPAEEPERDLPWAHILDAVAAALASRT